MAHWVWINGRVVPEGEATVSVADAGLLHGAGLFETLRAHQGLVFRLSQHLARMERSAEQLAIRLPPEFQEIHSHISATLTRNGLSDARVRITLTPGSGSATDGPLLIISAHPFEPYPAELYRRGMTVLVSSRQQTAGDASCSHKTLSYYNRLLALREAVEKGCQEALWFTPQANLAEGCITNVFVMKDGALCTPPLDTPVLPGITREVVMKLADASPSRPVREARLVIDDLLDAPEAFLTNSIMGVMPLCRVERTEIGTGAPGPVTMELAARYQQEVEQECGHAA